MIRQVSIAVALAAALVTSTPAPAEAHGFDDLARAAEALSRMHENLRLSAERDFYNRVANVEDRSAAAGLFAMPAARSVPPMPVTTGPNGAAFTLPGMDRAVKAVQSQPVMVTPWFFDSFTGIGIALRGRLF